MSTKTMKISLGEITEEVVVDMDDMHVVEGDDVVEVNEQRISDSDSNSSSSSYSGESEGESSSEDSMDDDENNRNGGDNESNALEPAQLTDDGSVLQLPRELCEHASIFFQFFKPELWTEELTEADRTRLQDYLPRFHEFLEPNEASTEIDKTVTKLFSDNEVQRFDRVPLVSLQKNLEAGNYRPDVLVWRRSIAKSKRREQRFRECERLSHLSKNLFISREKLLREAYKLAPDEPLQPLKMGLSKRLAKDQRLQTMLSSDMNVWSMRGRKRYHTILEELTKDFKLTDDEEDGLDEAVDTVTPSERQAWHEEQQNTLKSVLSFSSTSASANDRCIFDTFFKRRLDLPDDETMRCEQYGKRPRLSNRNLRDRLKSHRRQKLIKANAPEFETTDIRLRDVCGRAQVGGDDNFKRIIAARKEAAAARRAKLKAMASKAAAENPATPSPNVAQIQNSTPPKNTNAPLGAMTPAVNALGKVKVQNPTSVRPMIVNMSEPPALVPIQPLPSDMFGNKRMKKLDNAGGLTEVQQNLMGTAGNNGNAFDLDDVVPFDINDFDVELQQEEVETYDGPVAAMGQHQNSTSAVTSLPTFLNDGVNPANSSNLGNIGQAQQMPNNRTMMDIPKLKPITTTTPAKQLKTNLANRTTATLKQQPQVQNKNKAAANYNKSMMMTQADQFLMKQETFGCFFTMIRDVFCGAPNHRMKGDDVKKRINILLSKPSISLNDWYSQAESWQNLIDPAIDFLSGDFHDLPDEYVPYIEFKAPLSIYQWIGAGRDSDSRLKVLYNFWLKTIRGSSVEGLTVKTGPYTSSGNEVQIQIPMGVSSPPPPRCPTTWTVKPANAKEIQEFQRQERERFSNPQKAYTYRMNGFESVVGPIKNINSPALNKARGHTLMVGDRPNYVTILNLVRDATARLPNGEGTRAEIAELLKCSQYINRDTSENTLQSVVSGALDRMHIEADPCVRYEPKRKIWIYLHRNRSEGEFEQMHQAQLQEINRQQQDLLRKATGAVSTPATPSGVQTVNPRKLDNSNVTTTIPLTLPALVPSNSSYLITTNTTQQPQLQRQPNIIKTAPPVPPLKYNVPSTAITLLGQQQQKSLLKAMQPVQPQRQTAVKRSNSANANQTVPSSLASAKVLAGQQGPKIVRTVVSSNAGPNTAKSPTKQITYALAKNQLQNAQGSNPLVINSSTATLQNMQINNNFLGAEKGVEAKSIGATTYTMVGGKRVALSKPIIVNQIGNTSLMQQQPQQMANRIRILKQNNAAQQKPNIIPANSGNESQQHQTNVQTIVIDPAHAVTSSSALLSPDNNTTIQQPQQVIVQQTSGGAPKNVIRILPGVKNIINISPTDNKNVKISQNPNNLNTTKIIGQRVINKSTANAANIAANQTSNNPNILRCTPTKQIGSISVISGNPQDADMITTSPTSGGTVLKMSPQTFNAIQQKPGQHIIIKQGSPSVQKLQQNQQHLVIGNTAIVAQGNNNQRSTRNIVVQQQPSTQQVLQNINVATTSSAIAGKVPNKKIQINATNLTPEQQRVLIQSLKQQQQQQEPAKTQMQRQQQQKLTTIASTSQGQEMSTISGAPKHVAVVVSQSQGFNKIIKTVSPVQQDQQQQPQQQQQQQLNKTINKIGVSTSAASSIAAGQIISLDELLQQQTQQQQQQKRIITSEASNLLIGSNSNGQFTVMSQPSTSRIITIGGNSNVIATNSVGNKILTANPTTTTTSNSQSVQLISVGNPVQNRTSVGSTTAPIKVLNTSGGGSSGNTVISPNNFSITNLQGKVVFAAKPNTGAVSSAAATVTTTGGNSTNIKNIFPVNNNIIIGGQTIKLQGNQQLQTVGKVSPMMNSNNNTNSASQGNPNSQQQQLQTVIMGNQILRVLPQTFIANASNSGPVAVAKSLVTTQQPARIITAVASKSLTSTTNSTAMHTTTNTVMNAPKTLVLGPSGTTQLNSGQQIQLQSPNINAASIQNDTTHKVATIVNASGNNINSNKSKTNNIISSTNNNNNNTNNNRLVFAVQGGGQILLSPSQFQGGTLNLKNLQNIKLVSVAQMPQQQAGGQHPQQQQQQQQQQHQNISSQKSTPPTIIKAVNPCGSIIHDGATVNEARSGGNSGNC